MVFKSKSLKPNANRKFTPCASDKALQTAIFLFCILTICLVTMSCSSKNSTGPIIDPPINEHKEIFIQLEENIDGETLEVFIYSYSEFELMLSDFFHKPSNIAIFTFNQLLIEEMEFLEIIRNDQRVIRAEFEPFHLESTKLLTARLYQHVIDDALNEFLLSFTDWELTFMDFHHQPRNIINFAFNGHLIEENVFLEMIRNDERVIKAEFEPFIDEILVELTARLYNHIVDEALVNFLNTYADWELTFIDFHHYPRNIINFTFNEEIIEKNEFLEMIQNDERVIKAEFEPFVDEILSELTAMLFGYVVDDALEEFILSYDEFEFAMIQIHHLQTNTITFAYNSYYISEIDFLQKIRLDDRVMRAEYKPFIIWQSENLLLELHPDIDEEGLNDIILSYPLLSFELLSYNKETNEAVFSFDYQAFIQSYSPMPSVYILVLTDSRIISANLIEIERFSIRLHDFVIGDVLDDFISTYAEYDVTLSANPNTIINNMWSFHFNHYLVDYFELFNTLYNDSRVDWVDKCVVWEHHGGW